MKHYNNLEHLKGDLVSEIKRRQEDEIIEITNAELLIKLINSAENTSEAIAIAELGTTYRRTGFHFDKRLEKIGSEIKYFKKNNDLSFVNDEHRLTHKLIIGDNYDALLNLLISHKGKVDVIYIDPPYGKDNMGEFAKTNYNNAISRDNLLSMLYPRLQLAKLLLSEQGLIFCSIDSKNQAYVGGLFDEVFGEINFIENYCWESTFRPDNSSPLLRENAEFIFCYAKNKSNIKYFNGDASDSIGMPSLTKSKEKIKTIRFPSDYVRTTLSDGVYRKGIKKNGKNPPWELLENAEVKNGLFVTPIVLRGHSYWSTDKKIQDERDAGTEIWIKSEAFIPYYNKNKVSENRPTTILNKDKTKDYLFANTEMNAIFNKKVFDNPKPSTLIKYLANFLDNDSAIVLDFFAGSGTTGHAVMELNRQDGGSRQFILCTNNEVTERNPNGIAYDVTSKKLKRVMSGECYDESKSFKWIEDNNAYLDNLDVCEIGVVKNSEQEVGENPFEVIDEVLYDLPKFNNLHEKTSWICSNFENTQKYLSRED